jgi:hypothetical protein
VSTDQEYDEQADMLDQEDANDSPAAGPGPYPHFPHSQSMQPPLPPGQNQNYTAPTSIPPNQSNQTSAVFNGMNHLFDPYDPMLDADPFGLSASMHFPTMYDSR